VTVEANETRGILEDKSSIQTLVLSVMRRHAWAGDEVETKASGRRGEGGGNSRERKEERERERVA
jgi:hypothetical protein